jgi:hypothetical protein
MIKNTTYKLPVVKEDGIEHYLQITSSEKIYNSEVMKLAKPKGANKKMADWQWMCGLSWQTKIKKKLNFGCGHDMAIIWIELGLMKFKGNMTEARH